MRPARMLRRLSLSHLPCSSRPVSAAASVPSCAKLWSQESLHASTRHTSSVSLGNVAQSRSFAASANPDSLPSLAEAIQQELEYERSSEQDVPSAIPQPPSSSWTLSQEDGSSELVLTRQYKGEKINVILDVKPEEEFPGLPKELSDLEDSEEADSPEQMQDDIEAEEADDLLGPPLRLHFDVEVQKGGDTLRIAVSFDGEFLDIQHVSHGGDGEDVYDGPDFKSLDPVLQQSTASYLGDRGINTEFAEYLVTAHEAKEHKEYVAWLGRVQKFLS